MSQLLAALIAVALTGGLRLGYAASPDDPSAPQSLRAPAPDSGAAASTAYTLKLDQAMGRMLDKHPDLKLIGFHGENVAGGQGHRFARPVSRRGTAHAKCASNVGNNQL